MMMDLLRRVFGCRRCKKELTPPAENETFRRVREEAHIITGRVHYTNALVHQKTKSVQIAERALALSRGEDA